MKLNESNLIFETKWDHEHFDSKWKQLKFLNQNGIMNIFESKWDQHFESKWDQHFKSKGEQLIF